MGSKRIRVGLLKSRVVIKLHSDIPGFGVGLDAQYGVGIARWARVSQISAATFYASQQVGEGVTHWIELLRAALTNPEDMTTDMVVEHKGRRYRVVRARIHPDDEQFTAIECTDIGVI